MDDDIDYKILVNSEDQYCIWPELEAAPPGWEETGPAGSREDVLEWIAAHWTDIRPRSQRNADTTTAPRRGAGPARRARG